MAIEKGTVEKLPSGKFRLRVTVGYNEKGNPKRLSKTISAASIRKAYVELDEWIEDLEEHGYEDMSSITFEYFFENMWKKQAKLLMEARTFNDYKTTVETRVLPVFGSKKLTEIKPFEIRDFILSQKKIKQPDEELSRESKKRILSALSSVFNIALYEYRLIKENPCTGLRLPKKQKADRIKKGVQQPYSLEELHNLFEKLENETLHVKTVILTAFVTGAREGEIAALEVKHFLFDTNQVKFEQRIIKIPGKTSERYDGLKNGTELIVDVPTYYLEIIQQYIQERIEQRKQLNLAQPKHDYLFGHIDGKPINPSALYGVWRHFVKRADLRMIRFHDLRHTAASFLVANPAIPDKTVQEHLGHSDYRTTMNMYVHSIQESKKTLVDAVEDMINPKKQ
ncbi:tyrosine-type recombinase/integrase [Enterococcus sp. AZ103]|uniref:tyrosine-type recombinase/integrase n=1 Tax=Enterococcus sp. AZ103 TaxID=2774628 RepID=UPI003F23331C